MPGPEEGGVEGEEDEESLRERLKAVWWKVRLWWSGVDWSEEEELGRWSEERRNRGPSQWAEWAAYAWSALVALAALYNMGVLVARAAFSDLQDSFPTAWLILDYSTDLLFLADSLLSCQRGFLQDGLLVSDRKHKALHYARSRAFVLDLLSLLPTDLLYLAWPGQPLVRVNRLLRTYRLGEWLESSESRTNTPTLFRILRLLLIIFVLFHWNACLYFALSRYFGGPGADTWVFDYRKILNVRLPVCNVFVEEGCLATYESANWTSCVPPELVGNGSAVGLELCPPVERIEFSELSRAYVFCFYWSALILTTIGEQMPPVQLAQILFVILDIMLGLLTLAAIVGSVGAMVTSINSAEAAMSERLDGVKKWMSNRGVGEALQKRVVAWLAYTRAESGGLGGDEDAVLAPLPEKLRAELATSVHLDTLAKVKLFQDCEPGLLVALVLKLRLQVFSPDDYVCRKGDVGKEMYIVKRGLLDVVSEDGSKVFVTLKAGSVVGELSILDIPGAKNGNKRTASIRSQGYTDLFLLSKDDLWDALREYPEAKASLLHKGKGILRKDGLLDEEKSAAEAFGGRTMEQRLAQLESTFKKLDSSIGEASEDLHHHVLLRKRRLAALEDKLAAIS